ncbi:MAG: LysM peptidoglycan-binding domain-containing protein [Anaerolineae bacterium]|nr:LysM peptidoglycan-binding domain-containing protein [Anaerolineae bacterium]
MSLKFNVSIAALQQANGITNPNLIFVGQVLQIPGPGGTTPPTSAPGQPTTAPVTPPPGSSTGTYTVQAGDTLGRIATRFGTTVAAIVQLNGIANPNLIFVGQVLKVPGATGVQPTAAPGQPTTAPGGPPPANLSGFELGGQAANLSSGTAAVMKSAKMTWVKRQVAAGDGSAAGAVGQAHGLGFKILFSVIGDKNAVLNAGYQDGYASYVASLAGAGADAIEVWNEMNIDREWPTGQINPSSYVSLLTKAYNAIKAANRNTIVITGALAPTGAEGAFGLSRVWNDDRYYNGLAQAGAARVADCIGVHYNEGIVSPLQTSGDPRGDNYPTRYFSTMLNRALAPFPGKMACFTELGYLSPQGYGALPSGFGWAQNVTVAQQSQWLGQAAQRAMASGRVRLMIVFNVDFTTYGADPQAGYAIIRPGGSCPACSTLAAALP